MLSTQDFDLQKGRDDSTGPEKMNQAFLLSFAETTKIVIFYSYFFKKIISRQSSMQQFKLKYNQFCRSCRLERQLQSIASSWASKAQFLAHFFLTIRKGARKELELIRLAAACCKIARPTSVKVGKTGLLPLVLLRAQERIIQYLCTVICNDLTIVIF